MRRMAKEAVRKAIAVVGGIVSEKLVRLYCFSWWRSLSIVNKTKLLLLFVVFSEKLVELKVSQRLA